MRHILIVDDDPSFNSRLTSFLTRNNYKVSSVHSSGSALEALNKEKYDLVLTDFKLPGLNGLQLIQKAKQQLPELPFILITNYSDIRVAVDSIKLGAYEFVAKPINPDELIVLIEKALRDKEGPDNKRREFVGGDDSYITGDSPASVKIWEHITLVAPTRLSVLITGESGTGKEYAAKMIHRKSKRSTEPFVALDCGVLSKELAASELFGHVKGSFTGAQSDKTGHFELANNGTLFLDEVGNLPHDVQVQLLRAIQERSIRKVGSTQNTPVDVRIIAATNENLHGAINTAGFRSDLYHRLNEFEIRMPPLRDRAEDIEKYAKLFLKQACQELEKEVNAIDPQVIERLKRYSWPGNLRELKNIVVRAALLCPGDTISFAQIPEEIAGTASDVSGAAVESRSGKFGETDLKLIREEKERELIERTLKETKYNKSKTARLLNIHRKTLYAKLKQYNIDA